MALVPELGGELDMPQVFGGVLKGVEQGKAGADLLAMAGVEVEFIQVFQRQGLQPSFEVLLGEAQPGDEIGRRGVSGAEFGCPVATGGGLHDDIADQEALGAGEMGNKDRDRTRLWGGGPVEGFWWQGFDDFLDLGVELEDAGVVFAKENFHGSFP